MEQNDNKVKNEEETAAEIPDGAVITKKKGGSVYSLVIAGQVEGHDELPSGHKATKYELIIPQLGTATLARGGNYCSCLHFKLLISSGNALFYNNAVVRGASQARG